MNERMNGWISRGALQEQRPVFESLWIKSMLWFFQMPHADKFIFKYSSYNPTRLQEMFKHKKQS